MQLPHQTLFMRRRGHDTLSFWAPKGTSLKSCKSSKVFGLGNGSLFAGGQTLDGTPQNKWTITHKRRSYAAVRSYQISATEQRPIPPIAVPTLSDSSSCPWWIETFPAPRSLGRIGTRRHTKDRPWNGFRSRCDGRFWTI